MNRGPRRALLVTAAAAAVFGAGGAGVALASSTGASTGTSTIVETGYAVDSAEPTDPSTGTQVWTDEECERWKAQQDDAATLAQDQL